MATNEEVKILVFAGSLRQASLNKKLAKAAADLAQAAGAEVTLFDLRELDMPLYDGDIEAAGLPEGVLRLKELMHRHDAFLISSPEYNGSISSALKNAIDWASRQAPGEVPLQSFRGKVAALMSTSPGALGGLRSLSVVRAILEHLGVLVIPEQFAVAKGHEAFDLSGKLKDAKQAAAVEKIVHRLIAVTARLKA